MSSPSIHLTGGLGFIGSNFVRYLNKVHGISPIIYDRLDDVGEKWRNVAGLSFELRDWMVLDKLDRLPSPAVLIHLGADVDTTAPFTESLYNNNVTRPLRWFNQFDWVVYASSAAVYGAEVQDFTERVDGLKPLNPYAFTKWMLDRGAAKMGHVVGLRLFNVYGPNEAHKGDMASVVHKALNPQPNTGERGHIWTEFERKGSCYTRTQPHWALFKSHRSDVRDGEQRRDFIHVHDVCSVISHFSLSDKLPPPGLYNVGTGVPRTFEDLVKIVDPNLPIEYRDMPEELRDQYQYRTCADLTRLRATGYTKEFLSLEEGIERMRLCV